MVSNESGWSPWASATTPDAHLIPEDSWDPHLVAVGLYGRGDANPVSRGSRTDAVESFGEIAKSFLLGRRQIIANKELC